MENEIVPDAPLWPIPQRPRLCATGPPAPCPEGTGEYTVIPNTRTPKRSGDYPQAPSQQRTRSSDGDQEFSNRHCMSLRDVASFFEKTAPLDHVVAVDNAPMGRPSYLELYGTDACTLLLHRKVISGVGLANLPPGHTFTRILRGNPLPRALAASGAQIAGAK